MTDHVLLNTEDHAGLRVRTDRGAALGDAMISCITVPQEFRQVQASYPILFHLGDDRETFTAHAMFGFEAGENLYLDGDCWDARYVPLAIEIQPFLIGRAAPDSADKQVHVDMASPRIARGGEESVALFDADRRPTPYLESIVDKLGALDAGYQASGEFFAVLKRYELLEPLTLEITLDDGSVNRLVGFHGIDEAKVQALDAAALAELQAGDHLMPLFMALASLGQLSGLIARKNRKVTGG